jgi:hypothetical protein
MASTAAKRAYIDKKQAFNPLVINSGYVRERYLSSHARYAPDQPPTPVIPPTPPPVVAPPAVVAPVAPSEPVPAPVAANSAAAVQTEPTLPPAVAPVPTVSGYEELRRELVDIKGLLQQQSKSAKRSRRKSSRSSGTKNPRKSRKVNAAGFYDYDSPAMSDIPTFE